MAQVLGESYFHRNGVAEEKYLESKSLSCQINKLADWLHGDRVVSGHLVERDFCHPRARTGGHTTIAQK